jgi:hypothetical protein
MTLKDLHVESCALARMTGRCDTAHTLNFICLDREERLFGDIRPKADSIAVQPIRTSDDHRRL